MTALDQWIKYGLYYMFSHGVGALIVGLVIGFSPDVFAELYLAGAFNFWVIPIALLTDVFTFPLWVWYVIIIGWAGSIFQITRYREELGHD